jgi:hypothetical protein
MAEPTSGDANSSSAISSNRLSGRGSQVSGLRCFPAPIAFTLLATLNAGLGPYGSWLLIGDFADGDRRLAATVLLLLTPFYTFLALKFNANSIFLSLWP